MLDPSGLRAKPWLQLVWLPLIFCAVRFVPPTACAEPPQADLQSRLSPEEALKTFTLPDRFEIQLVAAEPDLVNPMTMALDEQGRIYVSLAHTYRYGPEGSPVDPPTNPIVRLEVGRDWSAFRRTVVASGFSDPVMGLAVRDGRLWATNLNELFVAELDAAGRASERRVVVRDAAKPWNPFGMYRVTFGRDGRLYLNVGDHPIKLSGPTNTSTVRGSTGGIFRCWPDGSDIELLAQGMRAPFALDVDPYGRVWALSNGEGNPNRLIQVIPGADYHFQTRPVDWTWLAGKHPHAPPVWENPPGAHTAVVAYYSSAFPDDYWGNLLVSNWGVHGFPSANHLILRHQLDDRGRLVHSEPFLTTTDPHFRPTQITLSPDGNLYVLDWYGRDDENDMSGRLYKVAYIGGKVDGRVPEEQGTVDQDLADRNHFARRQAGERMLRRGPASLSELARHVASPNPLAAAEALWTLRQADWPQAPVVMEQALEHQDWRVRRLAIELLRDRRHRPPQLERLLNDPDPEVSLEAALSFSTPVPRLAAVKQVLRRGAAKEPRLRYQGALEVAREGTRADFESLLSDDQADVRLAGLIALDAAFHDGRRGDEARAVLAARIAEPRNVPLAELLLLAAHWPHPELSEPVLDVLSDDPSADEFLGGLLVLGKLDMPREQELDKDTQRRFLDRVAVGKVPLATRQERMGILAIVAAAGPDVTTLTIIEQLVRNDDVETRSAAHRVLVDIGSGNPACIGLCRGLIGDPSAPLEMRLETIVSLAQIEKQLNSRFWQRLLESPSDKVALVALRCLRTHQDQREAAAVVRTVSASLEARGPPLQAEVEFGERFAAMPPDLQRLRALPFAASSDPESARRKAVLKLRLLARLHRGDPFLGQLVFRNRVCHRCHESNGRDETLGPSLAGVAATNSAEYLLDSILFPSQVIKTGFQLEAIVTRRGQLFFGRVTADGDHLLITSPLGDRLRIAAANIEQRQRLNQSIMPESLETTMSEPELIDLVAYLATLRDLPGTK